MKVTCLSRRQDQWGSEFTFQSAVSWDEPSMTVTINIPDALDLQKDYQVGGDYDFTLPSVKTKSKKQ